MEASLIIAASKAAIPPHLNGAIVECCANALKQRGIFTIALSGGSLPSFLSSIQSTFEARGISPNFDAWHVILADERCVLSSDKDSNLGSLNEKLFSAISIPKSQIYGITESKLNDSTTAVAEDYELIVRRVLEKSGGFLDLAVLGFGPDGHTCSLFPQHALLQEATKWVAPITDSPKPPANRITLTLPVLNTKSRHVIFCGAGESKSPILESTFSSIPKESLPYSIEGGKMFKVSITAPAPFPCAMVLPQAEGEASTLTWVVDAEAMKHIE